MENFFCKVYEIVRKIPSGRVTSYGAIARFLSVSSAARMVGWAMNAAHTDPTIPAHRVVNRNGKLTGKNHFEHPLLMQQLLENEGLKIENDTILNLSLHFWNPSDELNHE
jgi:methylated-DNA-protein-cysteine methyltransferase related protein